ncbi:hypothetical protein Q8F55_004155 [Vanrija albida]|uniref:Conserved oligomeric Golgi complex subunit 8 n=1 Tax=Vanrija albida TaxID=181172 RepID=A0ABR3Q6R7_9TREE
MEEAEEPAPSLTDLLQATASSRRAQAPDLASPAASSYLDELLALPLKSILTEASAISAEAASVESELTNLCFREYPTFISVHKCSSAVTSAFDDFSESLGNLLDAVPALEEECRTFVKSTSGVQNTRAKAALVQEHQDKLFDLLEIPQLMDTCVRNGYYQEALELGAHAEQLVARYPGIELVQDVAKEVEGVLQLMLVQLLALLREPIKLPALVKTVSYLRRLRSVDETELGLVFLMSRLSNFRTHLAGLDRDRPDPVRYVRKYVDLFREHIFDIISQFSAIFLESVSASSGIAASQLASFVGQCVQELVDLVAKQVPKVSNDSASLSSILVQLGYCSLAFARVGLDFSALITEPFAEAVQDAFSQTIDASTSALSATLAQGAKAAAHPSQTLMAHEYLQPLLASDSPLGFVKWDGTFEHLPTDLARFPPLAILVNGHLSALNSLRLLAPLSLHPLLAATQGASLRISTVAITQYVQQLAALGDHLSDAPTSPTRSSGGRAHLIRRNSETQLTPEARTAKRRETRWVCSAFADTWVKVVVPLLIDALNRGVYDNEGHVVSPSKELQQSLDALSAWVDEQADEKVPLAIKTGANGAGNGHARTPTGSGSPSPVLILEEEEVKAKVVASEPEEVAEPAEPAVLEEKVEDSQPATPAPAAESEPLPASEAPSSLAEPKLSEANGSAAKPASVDEVEEVEEKLSVLAVTEKVMKEEAPVAVDVESEPLVSEKTVLVDSVPIPEEAAPIPEEAAPIPEEAAEAVTEVAQEPPSKTEPAPTEPAPATENEPEPAPPADATTPTPAPELSTETLPKEAIPTATITASEAPSATAPTTVDAADTTKIAEEKGEESTPPQEHVAETTSSAPVASAGAATHGDDAVPTDASKQALREPATAPVDVLPVAETGGAATVPEPVSQTPSIVPSQQPDDASHHVTPPPPPADDAQDASAADTPADTTPAAVTDSSAQPSAANSRAASPTPGDAPSTSGGGAKKKNKKKKKGKK